MTRITITILALLTLLACNEETPFTTDASVPDATLDPDAAVPFEWTSWPGSDPDDPCAASYRIVHTTVLDDGTDLITTDVLWAYRPCSDDPAFTRPEGRWVAARHNGRDCPAFNPESFAGLFTGYATVGACREYQVTRTWPTEIPIPRLP